jgi:hypothetical protein
MLDPKTEDGKRAVVDALMRHCQSNEHVTQVLLQFLETSRDCKNLIAEVVEIARQTYRDDQPPPGCRRCELGPDERTGEMRWAPHVGVDRDGYSFAVRCPGLPGKPCLRGKWFKQRDRQPEEPKASLRMAAAKEIAPEVKRRAGGDD